MTRGVVIAAIGLAGAACSGSARKPAVEEPVGAMSKPTHVAPASLGSDYGTFDDRGRPDGDWTFDCDGIAAACRAWFEHGAQVMWSRQAGDERYLIEAHDGGWRWQWWTGDILRGEVGLVFAPEPWKPYESVMFPAPGAPLDDGHCTGPFTLRDPTGVVLSTGTCDGTRWTEWINYDAQGHVLGINRQSATGSDVQSLDGMGQIRTRTRVEHDGTTTDEAWFADGTPEHRVVELRSIVLESKRWYPSGKLAEDDTSVEGTRTLRRYTTAGRLVVSQTWKDMAPSGTWRTWYERGGRRSQVRFTATGEPAGPLVVWGPRGDKAGAIDLATMTWTDHKAAQTHAVSARAPAGAGPLEIDGHPACEPTDQRCLLGLVELVFSPSVCLAPGYDDLDALWRGRVRITVGFDRTGASGVVAVRDPGGLALPQRECLRESSPSKQFAQQLDVVLAVDTLTPLDHSAAVPKLQRVDPPPIP